MSETQELEGIKEVIAPNTNLANATTLDASVKINPNMAPGVVPPPMLPPILMEYARKVSSPFFIKSFNWATSNPNGTTLLDLDVSPTAPFWTKDFVPYFAHEAMKWAYYRGSFILRIVFLGSAAYRGTVVISRYFSDETPSAINPENYSNTHYHSIDGGNLVHTHHLRFSSRGGVKLTVPSGHPIVVPTLKFQDIYYERLKIKVVAPLNRPDIYPTTVPCLVTLEPMPDIEFFSRRNNLAPLASSPSEIAVQFKHDLSGDAPSEPTSSSANQTSQ